MEWDPTMGTRGPPDPYFPSHRIDTQTNIDRHAEYTTLGCTMLHFGHWMLINMTKLLLGLCNCEASLIEIILGFYSLGMHLMQYLMHHINAPSWVGYLEVITRVKLA